ncbi:hypothetical protein SKP52_17505 [Sphingopyxis fribergensis]|uniref:Fe2OG dioxygenase domain-containing protein n=1 Tax=Sphingopyxis fribergensis TaxID=1515612 RepID=A0A0A7PQY2_9SPHN|nr:hypothetical protein [Sphingopyxis fribergensis]AJA10372.1 hypothetical protein SKP52_17505 [Sphingopyxis fribergensis]
MTENAELYRERGYLALPGFVPTDVTHALLGMMKGDLVRGGVSFDQLKRKHALLANEAVEVYGRHYLPLSTFLWGMTPAVSALVGTELKPSYCYFRMYSAGDVCHVHSDRYACEHSLSLLLAASDELAWPLEVGSQHIEVPRERADPDFADEAYGSVPMLPGDAVLYQGVHRLHGRITPNPNRWSAHLFLHWVDPAGPYAEHAMEGVKIPATETLAMERA